MPRTAFAESSAGRLPSRHQRLWRWWPLLPLYPYGQRRTLVRELVPGRIWSFEQPHGVWYVAVPIRMTVVKVGGGLMLYSPVPPTVEVLDALRQLEVEYGPIHTIVLATASGLEHKLPVPAMARAFPRATLWVSDHQWSFPLQLPASWLGFPKERTKILLRDGLPHPDQLSWFPLGPLDLGLGSFLELACLDLATGALLLTDALVVIPATPPSLFDEDPTPLLFHARERGSEPLLDSVANRQKGWKRIVLFANYFRPECIHVPPLGTLLGQLFAKGCRNPRCHFGFYPFQWAEDWEAQADRFLDEEAGGFPFRLAPVLERLVFPRAQSCFLAWLASLGRQQSIRLLISAHYHAPQSLSSDDLERYAEMLRQREWAPSKGDWQTLATLDQTLVRLGVVDGGT